MKARPISFFAFIAFGLTLAATLLLWQYASFDVVWSWLIAITVITFFMFGYDKAMAGAKRTRVPEIVLLALTFFGGTLGAISGRIVFRHKTSKGFCLVHWGCPFCPSQADCPTGENGGVMPLLRGAA